MSVIISKLDKNQILSLISGLKNELDNFEFVLKNSSVDIDTLVNKEKKTMKYIYGLIEAHLNYNNINSKIYDNENNFFEKMSISESDSDNDDFIKDFESVSQSSDISFSKIGYESDGGEFPTEVNKFFAISLMKFKNIKNKNIVYFSS